MVFFVYMLFDVTIFYGNKLSWSLLQVAIALGQASYNGCPYYWLNSRTGLVKKQKQTKHKQT